ncbi:helix-turn-helix domain-containing protein [Pseudoxanthomonas sp. LH2527]|uniref:helix-turn-helix domain-containing protein n=1 Tax=Pseudoxanthomonas sp. LH2527 TaxID=2923249 RepID=UPI001F1327FB|nr:helix-turn-helix transcriptional regulator [Pseudoxanthomonas sp. LH2527]MCH6484262.1 helix-turn-helix domain-containing protein [Pseudoxanthomonas sp. LH2527]
MNPSTLGQRLKAAMDACGKNAAAVAGDAGTTEGTISNWVNDSVSPDNVKAAMLFAIADAVKEDPRYLLGGSRRTVTPLRLREVEAPPYIAESSQLVQLEAWKIAFQLVAEALGNDLTLPPDKQAEVTLLTHDLLTEGMPRAKVLRFVRAAAA